MLKFTEFLDEATKKEKLENEHDFSKLSNEEIRHVFDYSLNSSDLNNHLFKSHTNQLSPKSWNNYSEKVPYKESEIYNQRAKNHQNKITHLDSAIAKHKLQGNLTVKSGVPFHPDEEASKHPDRHVHLPAYTSSSLSQKVAESFATSKRNDKTYQDERHVLHIRMKKGHSALPILNNSSIKHEQEVLIPRHTSLKIADKPHKTTKHKRGDHVHHWHADVVHQGEE